MRKQDIPVFLYGTLLPGQSNHGTIADTYRPVAVGFVAGRLVDADDGAYPALVQDEMAVVRGLRVKGLWIVTNRQGLSRIDELEQYYGIEEENDYDRVWTTDLGSPKLSGWVYVWESPRGRPAIEEGYWPDFVARQARRS